MKYELLNTITPGTEAWDQVVARAKKNHERIIVLAAMPNFAGILNQAGLKGVSLIDRVCNRTYKKDDYMFFDRIPVPTGAKIEMNEDGNLNVLYDGDKIANVSLYPNTRRAVQDVRYLNPDGTLDYIEEYATDGSHYTNIYYYNNEMQEIDFLDMQERPVLRYYLYEGVINFVTIENPVTREVTAKYNSVREFVTADMPNIVKPNDTVTISYMGIELDALGQTNSHNILAMVEDPFDEHHEVRGNLQAILKNDIKTVQEVQVPVIAYQELQKTDLPSDKLKLLK